MSHKYQLKVSVTLNFESDLGIEAVRKVLKKCNKKAPKPPNVACVNMDVRKVVPKVPKPPKPKKEEAPKNAVVLAEYKPDEVFPHIGVGRKEFVVKGKTYPVKMSSQRLILFKDSPACVACGLEGTMFRLEQQGAATSPHFNFYATEDGQPVLMTKDHIKPKSKGGEDLRSNFQTMCCVCNCLKGNSPLTLNMIQQLRETLRTNKALPKKALIKLMSQEKERLLATAVKDISKMGKVTSPMWTISDLGLFDLGEGDIWAYGSTAKLDPSVPQIACVRRKTPVTPIAQAGDVVTVTLRCGSGFKTWLRNLSQTE